MDGLVQLARNLGPARLAAMVMVIVGMVVFFALISSRLNRAPQGILFTDLEMSEAAEVTERLNTMQVPFKLSTDGRTIFAPSDQLATLRLQFASEGIGGGVGYELLDKQDALGTTSFMQQVNHRRAIEGELARTIQAINTVREARVHLVMPERALFAQEQTLPSASVVLRTKAGRLGLEQVHAIRQLVAASVAGLPPERISIVDQFGSLLARIDESSETANLTDMHERQQAMQTALERQVESLLERTVGPGRVRAEVAVKLNNERVSTQSEVYDPEAQVVVSTSLTERASSESETEGGDVTVANNLPDNAAANADGAQANSNETQETTNFQNSRTQTTRVREIGSVERISIAVLVDGTYADGGDGSQVYSPRGAEELAQLERLAKSAVGFDETRGDTIEIASMQFTTQAIDGELPEPTSVFGLDLSAFERTAEIAVLGIVSVLVLLLVVRPIIKKVIEAAPVQQQPTVSQAAAELTMEERPALPSPDSQQITPELLAKAADGDEEAAEIIAAARLESEANVKQMGIDAEIDVAQVEGRLKGSALKKVGGIINKHPDESTAIIRQWLHGA